MCNHSISLLVNSQTADNKKKKETIYLHIFLHIPDMYIGGGALVKKSGFKSVTGTKWCRSYPKCFGFVLKKKKEVQT